MRNDAITLDTNVLEHFFNPQFNGDGHITSLLGKIVRQGRRLCMDDGQRMSSEMFNRLANYKQHGEFGNFSNLMRGLLGAPKEEIKVDHADGLKSCIDKCVPVHTEQSDKVIMFVACMSDTALVSNNNQHITDHAGCLKKCAGKHSGTTPEFWDSRTANANL